MIVEASGYYSSECGYHHGDPAHLFLPLLAGERGMLSLPGSFPKGPAVIASTLLDPADMDSEGRSIHTIILGLNTLCGRSH